MIANIRKRAPFKVWGFCNVYDLIDRHGNFVILGVSKKRAEEICELWNTEAAKEILRG
jgi:hypothetical protein